MPHFAGKAFKALRHRREEVRLAACDRLMDFRDDPAAYADDLTGYRDRFDGKLLIAGDCRGVFVRKLCVARLRPPERRNPALP